MNKRWPIPRRSFLKSSAAVIGLPFLEAMLPWRAMGESARTPKRFVVCYVPNGVVEEYWFPKTPQTAALAGDLPATLQPLDAFKKNMILLRNVSHIAKVRDNWDGNGSAHAFAASSFLTAVTLDSRNDQELLAAPSVDQIIARKLALESRLPSLELGCDPSNLSQPCVAFSPVYPQTISWKTPTQPNPKEINPQKAFQRLFTVSDEQALSRKSILDSVLDASKDFARLNGLSALDKTKLDEYYTSVRDTEQAWDKMKVNSGDISKEQDAFAQNTDDDYPLQLRLMFKLMTLALKTNTTHVITFMMGQEISQRTYPFLGISAGHHDLSHYRAGEESLGDLVKINRFHAEEFAKFVQGLSAETDESGSLLDSSVILYGGGMSNGNGHSLKNLPLVLLGGKASSLAFGNQIVAPDGSTLANLHLTLARAFGLNVPNFTEAFNELSAIKS